MAAQHLAVSPLAAAQPISPITGFPIWLEQNGLSADVESSVAYIVVLSTFGAAIFSSYTLYSRRLPYRTHNLYHLIALYCWATAFSMFMSRFVTGGTGKFWAPAGGLHNLVEWIILFTFLVEGKAKFDWFVWWVPTLLYIGLVVLVHWLPFPYDAFWFKLQGLVGDACLPIVFTQLMYAQWHGNHVANFDYSSSIVAALLHLTGNVLISIFGGGAAFYYVFSLSYAFAYPLYAYFIRQSTLLEAKLLADDPENGGVDSPLIGRGAPVAIEYPQVNWAVGISTLLGGLVVAGGTMLLAWLL